MQLINNKYEIIDEINSGSFGKVYKVKYNNNIFALKEDSNKLILKHEYNIYKKLQTIDNVPKLIDYFNYKNSNYLLIDYYQLDLITFKMRFSTSITYIEKLGVIFKTILYTLKEIHNLGIIHRDLKPSNICLNNNFIPFIIDYGLSKEIIIKKKHIEIKNIKGVIGSNNFASLNVLNLIEPSRRDDIESFLYIYLYTLLNEFAYQKYSDLNINQKKNIEFISKYLESLLLDSSVIFNKNTILNYVKIFTYVRKMKFTQQPNYKYIDDILLSN